MSTLPALAILAALAAVPGILLLRNRPNGREAVSMGAAVLALAAVGALVQPVLEGMEPRWNVLQALPGVSLGFKVDGLGVLFGLVASSLWLVAVPYSAGYLRGLGEHAQTRFFACFALAIAASLGVAFSANLLTLYLFYEMLSLSTWPLVTHHQDEEARRAGRRYLGYLLGGSIGLVLPAMVAVYWMRGTLEFTGRGIHNQPPEVLALLLGMFLFGFAKAAVMPMHGWLPGAMVAPTPVSALLHAVAVVKVGVFSVVRVLTGIFGLAQLRALELDGVSASTVLCLVASFTVLSASALMLVQDNLKRCLAYSTIAQLSYILLGVSLLSPLGVTGGVLHIAMHAFGKITLFFCAGAIYVASGRKKISELDGLGRRMPWTFGAFFLGALAIIGLPPTGGFLSKWFMALGALQAQKPWVVAVIFTSSLLKAAALLPIVYRAWFHEPREDAPAGEAPPACVLPLCLTALASVALFFAPRPFLGLADHFLQTLLSR